MLNVWIGNLGKYNEGELVGGWLKLPKSDKEIDEFLKNVVELNDEYEEYMINDYETDLPYKVYEYDSIRELNLLAKIAEEVEDMDKINGYIDAQGSLSKLELMNLLKQEDRISFYNYEDDVTNASLEHKYGYTMAELWGVARLLEDNDLSMYFDYEKYGRDRSMCCNVALLDEGYIDLDDCNIDLSLYSIAELIEEYSEEENTEEDKRLRVIYKEVGKEPVVMEIEDTLEAKQKLVGGLIEVVPYKENLLLVCNEEGKILNQKPNINFGYDYIAGNCFVIGDDIENAGFKSIEENQIEDIKKDLEDRTIILEEIEETDEMEV